MHEQLTSKDRARQAAALRYKPHEDRAPVLVAKGQGIIAERIIALAKEHEIPIFRDDLLVGLLMSQPLDTGVPPTLYQAVAEVLAFLYRMKGNKTKGVRKNAER